jgi:hypothetical protein
MEGLLLLAMVLALLEKNQQQKVAMVALNYCYS